MSDFQMPDVGKLTAALDNKPLSVRESEKGQFFNLKWWPDHHKKIEGPVLEAIAPGEHSSFDRRVNILRIAEDVDVSTGSQLKVRSFTSAEITRYVTRAMNRRLKEIGHGSDTYYVIRNQKLNQLKLNNKPAE